MFLKPEIVNLSLSLIVQILVFDSCYKLIKGLVELTHALIIIHQRDVNILIIRLYFFYFEILLVSVLVAFHLTVGLGEERSVVSVFGHKLHEFLHFGDGFVFLAFLVVNLNFLKIDILVFTNLFLHNVKSFNHFVVFAHQKQNVDIRLKIFKIVRFVFDEPVINIYKRLIITVLCTKFSKSYLIPFVIGLQFCRLVDHRKSICATPRKLIKIRKLVHAGIVIVEKPQRLLEIINGHRKIFVVFFFQTFREILRILRQVLLNNSVDWHLFNRYLANIFALRENAT